MTSTARWVPPWQVVQRPQLSSSQKPRKYLHMSRTQAVSSKKTMPPPPRNSPCSRYGSSVRVRIDAEPLTTPESGPPGWKPLNVVPSRMPPAPLVEALADGGAERDLDAAGPVHLPEKVNIFVPFSLASLTRTPPVRAVAHDHRRVGVRLDVVDVRGLVPEAGLGRERRLDARHAAVAVDRSR